MKFNDAAVMGLSLKYRPVIEAKSNTAVMGFLVRCSLEVKAKSNNCCLINAVTKFNLALYSFR